MAAAAADALPPPGVAVGAASASSGASACTTNPTAAVWPAPCNGRHLLHQSFELPAPDVLQIHPLGLPGCCFVVVHLHLELFPNHVADALGELDTVLEGNAFDRNKR